MEYDDAVGLAGLEGLSYAYLLANGHQGNLMRHYQMPRRNIAQCSNSIYGTFQ
jgi:hypothetical protein